MGRGKKLTEYECGQIDSFSELGFSGNQIASKINKSRRVVQNHIRDKENYGKNKPKGRELCYTERDKRRISSLASEENKSVRKISALLNGRVSNNRPQCSLQI